MLGFLKRLAASIAAVASLAVVPAVSADPIVQFSVTGQFSVGTLRPGHGEVTNNGTVLGVGGNVETTGTPTVINTWLAYTGTNFTLDLGEAQYASTGGYRVANVNFGSLALTSSDPNGTVTREKYREYDGAGLTLTFTQLQPSTGSHQVVSKSIHGTVWYSEDSAGTGSYLSIKFAEPLIFTIPQSGSPAETVRYTFLTPTVRINNPDGTGSSSAVIGGQVSAAAAPLPAPVLLGLTLMGGFGGFRGLKKLRDRRGAAMAPAAVA